MPKRWTRWTRWTEEEECYLQKIASLHLTEHYEGHLWWKIAEVLNSKYHNGRTPKACENRFYRLHGDDYKFVVRRKN